MSDATSYDVCTGRGGEAVTPSDSTIYSFRALWIGTGGDVTITAIDGSVAEYKNVPDGYRLDVAGTKVMAATTAEDITTIR